MTQNSWRQGLTRAAAEQVAGLATMTSHLDAVDGATTGVSNALEILARQGDDSLVTLDEDDDLVSTTEEGQDLLDALTAIDRARRDARRILQVRITELLAEQGA